jgi:hypothetical protein
MKYSVGFFFVIVSLYACGDADPRPSAMTGWYDVSLASNHEEKQTEDDQKREINIRSSKGNNEEDASAGKDGNLVAEEIDTTTAEGKIKYAARQFEKSMESLGENVSSLGKGISDVFSAIAENGIHIKNGILDDVHFKAELQEDGDIKIKDMPFDLFQVNDAKWEVKGKHFYIIRPESDTATFEILKKSGKQIVLVNKNLKITLDRIEEKRGGPQN